MQVQRVIELFGKKVNNALNVHLITKRRQDHKDLNFARIFARILLVFLLKMRPYFARIFTKMSPYEELGTLDLPWNCP